MATKYEIRRRALLEAVRFCGGVAAYSRCLSINRSRASNWINQSDIEIPYEYAVLTEEITQVSIERLSPFTEAANKVIRRLRYKGKTEPIYFELKSIIVGEHRYFKYPQKDRRLIVGTDGVLIPGLAQMEVYKSIKMKKVPVIIVDLEALLLQVRSIRDINTRLLISDKIAIGLRLEQLLGNQQGQRHDLLKRRIRKIKDFNQLRLICNEVKGSRGDKVACASGFQSKASYYRARQVYLEGNQDVIDQMDNKEISIAMASKLVKNKKIHSENARKKQESLYDAKN